MMYGLDRFLLCFDCLFQRHVFAVFANFFGNAIKCFKCVKECLGSAPTTDGNYFTNGMYDSKERIKMWLEKRIDFCDILWNYK